MNINFKEQIFAWWNSKLEQFNTLKEAQKEGTVIKLAGEGEVCLSDEQSAQLLAQLIYLVDAFLESDFPVFKIEHSDTKAAIEVYNWHLMAWGDVLDRVDELNEKKDSIFISTAQSVLNDLVELPFTLSKDEDE